MRVEAAATKFCEKPGGRVARSSRWGTGAFRPSPLPPARVWSHPSLRSDASRAYVWPSAGLLVASQRFEFVGVDGIGQQGTEFAEVFVGGKGIGRLEEAVFGGVDREDLAEGAELTGGEALGFEDFESRCKAIIVLRGFEHFYPEFVDVVVGGKVVAVRVDIW